MEWTIRWYTNMAEKWRARRDAAGQLTRGHVAYAEKQMAMWNELGRVSEVMFCASNDNHPRGWYLVV